MYDKNGHLCPFDESLIEQDKLLYFSGYIKPIFDEDPSPENGIPAMDMGPINAWFLSGFDGGTKVNISLSTGYGEYYLMDPSPDYAPLMQQAKIKMTLTKLVIEYLADEAMEEPSYEDLLYKIDTAGGFDEESLLRNAQFLCNQVVSFDAASTDPDERPLIATPCMRDLVKMAGVTFKKSQKMPKIGSKSLRKKTVKKWSKATTTDLVREVFENFFLDQIAADETSRDKGPKKRRCGVCEACQNPDCGKCAHCQDMIKFGGTGRGKQACKMRKYVPFSFSYSLVWSCLRCMVKIFYFYSSV